MQGLDQRIFWLLYGHGAASLTFYVMRAATMVGGGWGLVGLVPVALHRDGRALARTIAAATVLQAVLVFALKHIFLRERPWQQFHLSVENAPLDPSFPSGHSAGSFAVALVCAVWLSRREPRRWLGVCLIPVFLAALVATSRVYLGVHYPSDVLAGSVIGGAIGFAVAQRAFPPGAQGAASTSSTGDEPDPSKKDSSRERNRSNALP